MKQVRTPSNVRWQERLSAVVFDFDGTLAELTLDFDDMKRQVQTLAHRRFPRAKRPGPAPALEWLAAFGEGLAGAGEDAGAIEAFTREAMRLVEDIEAAAARRGRLFDHALPAVQTLDALGVKKAIITRNCGAAVLAVFPDALQRVECVLAREDVPAVKPDPGHLLAALAILDCPPGRALMVGDHPMDVETGRRAGTLTAAVASGRMSLEALASVGPDLLAQDCGELIRLLFDEKADA